MRRVWGCTPASSAAPAALDPEGAAVLGPRGDLQGHLAVEGRHGQLGAERRFREGHRHRHGQVLAAPAQQRVRGDMDLDDQVAGGRAGDAGLALALQPDDGAVAHPGGDAYPQLARADLGATAVAGLAGVVDDCPTPLAGRARAGEAEQALVTGDRAAAVAGRAHPRQRPGLRAGALAGVAGGRAAELQRDGRAPHGLLEPEGDLALDVAAAPGGALLVAPAAEEVPEEAAEPSEVAEVTEILDPDALVAVAAATGETAEAAERARPDQPSGLVVLGPLLGIGEHAVGPPDLLETLLGGLVAVVGVRVELLGELPIGLLDVLGRSVLGHSQDGVEVLLEILRVVHALPGYLHHGRAQDPAVELISLADHVNHRARLDAVLLDGHHGLVPFRVERLPARLDGDQALADEHVVQLAEDHLDALEHAVEVPRLLGVGDRQLEVVEHGQQPRHQRLGGGGDPRGLLAHGPLAVVVELGLEPAAGAGSSDSSASASAASASASASVSTSAPASSASASSAALAASPSASSSAAVAGWSSAAMPLSVLSEPASGSVASDSAASADPSASSSAAAVTRVSEAACLPFWDADDSARGLPSARVAASVLVAPGSGSTSAWAPVRLSGSGARLVSLFT